MSRNTRIRLGIYPVAIALAVGLLWALFSAQRSAQAETLATQSLTEFGLGLWDIAEQHARDSVALDGSNPQGWTALGEILGRRARRESDGAAERRTESRQVLETALTLCGTNPEQLHQLADGATKAGLFDIAERAATIDLQQRGNMPHPLWLRGRARWLAAPDAAGRGPAREDLEQACATARDGDIPAQIAALAMMFKDTKLAMLAAGRTIGLAPEDPEGPAIAAWLAEQALDTDAALQHYDSAVQLARAREGLRPAGTVALAQARRRFLAELFFRRGALRFTQDPASAAPDLDASFELNPGSAVVAHLTAQARLAADRPEEAADALQRAWTMAAKRPEVRDAILTQVRAGDWDALPDSPLRDTLQAAAKQ